MIADLSKQGGISDWHLERVKDHADYLGEKGDVLQFYVKGQSGKAMKVLCECLAVLAFMPGGVKFSGLHFEGKPTYEGQEMPESLAGVAVTDEEIQGALPEVFAGIALQGGQS
jgi:hypothetical protein